MPDSPTHRLSSVSRSVFELDSDIELEEREKIEEQDTRDLSAYPNVAALIDALTIRLGFAYLEARQIVLTFSAGRCEGALVKTLWDVGAGGIRHPRGWFLGALREGREWTADQVKLHRDWLRQKELQRMEQSNNITEQRLAREERERRTARDAGAITSSEAAASGTIQSAGPS